MSERHVQHRKRNTRVNCTLCPPKFVARQRVFASRRKSSSFNGTSHHAPNGDPLRSATQPYTDLGGLNLQDTLENNEESPRLSLELEIDESIKNLLRQGSFEGLNPPDQPTSLDVTLIQEADTPVSATVSLGMDEVSHLIDMVHAKGNHAPPAVEMEGEKAGAFLECYTTDYATEDDEDLYARGIVPPKAQQVYTTPQQTFNQIRSKLPCLTHSHNEPQRAEENFDKPGTPCLCQHCGMVGVLVESQKRPAIPHSPNPKFSGYPRNSSVEQRSNVQRNPRKTVDLRAKSKSETNLILLRELTSKISSLEDRLNEYEEKTVKKDYFKFVIHKLLTQYSNKINELRSATYYANKPNVNMGTQYSKKPVPQRPNYGIYERVEKSERPEKEQHTRYYPVHLAQQVNTKSSTEDFSSEQHCRRVYRPKGGKRAGALFPARCDFGNASAGMGRQISHNVNTLLVSNSPPESSFVSGHSAREEAAGARDNLSAHAIKNLCDIVYSKFCDANNNRERERERDREREREKERERAMDREREKVIPEKLLKPSGNASNYSAMPRRMAEKMPPACQPNSPAAGRAPNGKNRCNSPPPGAPHCAQRMDVAYVSPALETWHDESEQEFATAKISSEQEAKREQHSPRHQHQHHYQQLPQQQLQPQQQQQPPPQPPQPQQQQERRNNSGRACNTATIASTNTTTTTTNTNTDSNEAKNKHKHSIEEKIKYLKYLAKRKNVDECELWANILNQAKKHIRSNEDTVSIQLPCLARGPEMSELELTLSTLKGIVRRSRHVRGKKSSAELVCATSSERLRASERKRGDDARRHVPAR